MSLEVSFVDLTDPKNAVTALKPNTKLVINFYEQLYALKMVLRENC